MDNTYLETTRGTAKRLLAVVLALLMIFSCAFMSAPVKLGLKASADGWSPNKVCNSKDGVFIYSIEEDNEGYYALILGYNMNYTSDTLIIPSEFDGFAVKAIMDDYGKGLPSSVKSLIIPDTVELISFWTFSGSSLSSVTFGKNLKYVDICAFRDCNELKTIELPDSVTYIGGYAFSGCSNLTSVILSKSLNSLEERIFYGCTSLKTITIPDSVTSIGASAFDVTSLNTLTLGKGVKEIGDYAFPSSITKVNYTGSKEQFNKIKFGASKENITNAKITYNYKPESEKAPAAPKTLTASTSTTSVKLTWSKVTGASGYRVYKYDTKTKKYVKVADTTNTTYTIKNLKAGTAYKYQIKAYKKSGSTTLWSTGKNISVTTNIAAPKTLTASTSTTSVKLTWSKVTGASGYRVYKYDTKTKKYVKVADTAKTTYTVKNLKAGTAYKYQIKAYKKSGSTTLWSAEKNISVTTNIAAPKTLKASQTATSVKLTWSKVTDATGYRVYKYDTKTKKYVKVADTTKTTYTVKKLKAGTTYKYQVKAYKKSGKTTIWSAAKSLTTATKPATPTLTVKAGAKKATLSWKKISGASGYQVYMATSKNGKFTKVATVSKGATVKYTKTGLTKGKTCYFKVRAYVKAGSGNVYGAYSAVKSVKIK